MHLSHTIFQWPFGLDGKTFPPEIDYVLRGQEIWRHARARLKGSPTELDRVDCIGTLKRAINHRLKAIQATYRYDVLPSVRAKKQVLEKLQDYGIVRPAILKELLEVRNGIEHNDDKPPDLARCEFYLDIVWYFLKSTDVLVDMAVDSLAYEDHETQSFLYFAFQPQREWEIKVHGTVISSLLRLKPEPGDLKLLDVTSPKRQPRRGFTKFTATVETNAISLQKLAQEYFSVSGYSYEDGEA